MSNRFKKYRRPAIILISFIVLLFVVLPLAVNAYNKAFFSYSQYFSEKLTSQQIFESGHNMPLDTAGRGVWAVVALDTVEDGLSENYNLRCEYYYDGQLVKTPHPFSTPPSEGRSSSGRYGGLVSLFDRTPKSFKDLKFTFNNNHWRWTMTVNGKEIEKKQIECNRRFALVPYPSYSSVETVAICLVLLTLTALSLLLPEILRAIRSVYYRFFRK